MKKDTAKKLMKKIEECEVHFSNTERDCNYNNDSYEHSEIIILSEATALVKFRKKSGKESYAIFFYIKNYWIYFFLTDSHELGMWNFIKGKYRVELEKHNFPHNFDASNLEAY